MEYAPRFALWADGAGKSRWIDLPPDTQIDSTDMDHWSFPVGTRVFKEFQVNGVRVETRMIERWGTGAGDFLFATYQWNATQNEAYLVTQGVVNANGTTHDIPPVQACHGCHDGLREHILGFSFVQLSHAAPGITLDALRLGARLTAPPGGDFVVPGDARAQAALGYLHANCGHCHNLDDGVKFVKPFGLRLLSGDQSVTETSAYTTAVGKPLTGYVHPPMTMRIAPGYVDASAVSYRMSVRVEPDQMPPLATKDPDMAGLAAVNAWIQAL
jgi:hypothetical protein